MLNRPAALCAKSAREEQPEAKRREERGAGLGHDGDHAGRRERRSIPAQTRLQRGQLERTEGARGLRRIEVEKIESIPCGRMKAVD
jgi:hypothetical protein